MVSFLESPADVKFLHILVQAFHFEFIKVGCASIRNICNFLELTQLSSFVAASYGTHQKISDQMDTIIGQFGDMEKARLSMLMPEKLITLCEDETFHPQICLVAIEPDSNYIILEQYEKNRSGATWNQAVSDAIGNLPGKVIQGTSDEGKGLIYHVTKGLNSHHSPDLFHVMYEISRGTGAPLSAAIGKAEKEQEARTSLEQEMEHRETVSKQRKEISRAYHLIRIFCCDPRQQEQYDY